MKKQELFFFLINNHYSIHPLFNDASFFAVFRNIKKFTFSEFTYSFCSIFPGESSLSMLFVILEFTLIHRSTSISEGPLSIFFTFFPLSYIQVPIRRSKSSLSMFFPVLEFTLILRSTGICESTLPMFFPILEIAYILVPTGSIIYS